MPDGSANVDFVEWRIVRLPKGLNAPQWPFLELDVDECFIEDDLSKWGSIRTKACTLRRRFEKAGIVRTWQVSKTNDMIVVRRVE